MIFSGSVPGYGNMVEVDHENGLVTRYGHNSLNLVATDDEVQAGQSIALIGSTGRSIGSHLHFEVRKVGKRVDPSVLLGESVKELGIAPWLGQDGRKFVYYCGT